MERFTTLDIYLAAYLAFHEIEPVLESHGGKVVFVFPQDREVSFRVSQFNSNVFVRVADYVTLVKALRGRMLQAKGGKR